MLAYRMNSSRTTVIIPAISFLFFRKSDSIIYIISDEFMYINALLCCIFGVVINFVIKKKIE